MKVMMKYMNLEETGMDKHILYINLQELLLISSPLGIGDESNVRGYGENDSDDDYEPTKRIKSEEGYRWELLFFKC